MLGVPHSLYIIIKVKIKKQKCKQTNKQNTKLEEKNPAQWKGTINYHFSKCNKN